MFHISENQKLDFEEFCKLIEKQLKDRDTLRAELEEAFLAYDRDKSGKINFEELKAVLKSNGSSMSDDEISDLIGEVDVDGDGQVNFEGNQIVMSIIMHFKRLGSRCFLTIYLSLSLSLSMFLFKT